jgi:signal peptidase I
LTETLPKPTHTSWSDLLKSLSGTVVIAVFVVTFIVQAFQIPSESMENTLLIGDYLLVDKLHFGAGSFGNKFIPYRQVQRGDIVVFHYPVDPSVHFVKRVVGVPGDKIRLIHKKVYVNGVALNEPYVRYFLPPREYRDEFPKLDLGVMEGVTGTWWQEMQKLVVDNQLIVPEGNYFVMGDNRDDSLDSRFPTIEGGVGMLPVENLIGRASFTFWSTDGRASWFKPWTWFSALRASRIGNGYTGVAE